MSFFEDFYFLFLSYKKLPYILVCFYDYNIYVNIHINVQSNNVSIIQEVHLFLGHYILNEVEQKILKKK